VAGLDLVEGSCKLHALRPSKRHRTIFLDIIASTAAVRRLQLAQGAITPCPGHERNLNGIVTRILGILDGRSTGNRIIKG
jgi:hypothetical protein